MARTPEEEKYFQAAKKHHEEDGTLEFDHHAEVSISSAAGAYVQGWVWVSDEEAGVKRP